MLQETSASTAALEDLLPLATKADANTGPLVMSVISHIAQDNPREALWLLRQSPDEVKVSPEIGLLLQKLAKSPEAAVHREANTLLRQMLIPPTALH